MRKTIWMLAVAGLMVFTACKKDDDNTSKPKPNPVVSIDASAPHEWQYFSFAEKKLVGTGIQSDSIDSIWFAKTNWDIAIQRYKVRTNSGTSSSTGAQGGVYFFDENTTFESITSLPADISFAVDTIRHYLSMGAPDISSSSIAQVVTMKKNEEGNPIMPPVYLETPVYAFRTADGQKTYKVDFIQYKDAEGVSGKVKFNVEEIK